MQNPLRVITAVALCAFLVACDSVEERAEEHFENAVALVAEGDFDRAAIEFRNVFELDPLHREARQAYGEMLLEAGDAPRAFAQYRRLTEQFPDDLSYREVLTRLAMENQDWTELRRSAPPFIEGDPDNLTARVAALALEYLDAIEAEDMAAQSGVAVRVREIQEEAPDFSILNVILVQQAVNDQNPEVALEQLDSILAADEDNLEYHMLRVQLLAGLDRIDEVEASLISLIDQFPEQDDLILTLMQFYGSQGRVEDAIAYLRDYVGRNEDAREARNTLIELVLGSKGPEAAIAEVDRLLESETDSIVLLTQRARLQFEGGDAEAGIAAIEALLADVESADAAEERTEEIGTAKMVLARMLIGTGNQIGARRQVEEVLASDGSNVAALKLQSAWLIDDDNPDEAVTLLRTAIDVSPDDWEAMLLMADAFNRSGDHPLARDFVSLAVETSGNAVMPSLRFAQLLISEDRLILAEETLVNALRQAPQNLELLAALGRLQVQREDWPRVAQVEDTLNRIGSDEAVRIATGLRVGRLANTQQVEEAMKTLEDLGEQDSSVQTVAAVVRARLSSGDTAGAVERAEEALADDPDNLGLRMILASAQVAVGEVEAGRAVLEGIVAENDQVEAAWTALVRLETATGTAESRDAMLARALEAMPNSLGLGWAMASILTENGEVDEAIAMYEDLYERQTSSLLLANNLATLLANHRDDEASIERAYAVARRLRGSTVPAFQDTYGWIAYRRGEFAEAVTYLELAVAALPEEPSVQYHLGMAYLAVDRKPDALKHLQLAAESDGNRLQFPEVELAEIEAQSLVAEGVTPSE